MFNKFQKLLICVALIGIAFTGSAQACSKWNCFIHVTVKKPTIPSITPMIISKAALDIMMKHLDDQEKIIFYAQKAKNKKDKDVAIVKVKKIIVKNKDNIKNLNKNFKSVDRKIIKDCLKLHTNQISVLEKIFRYIEKVITTGDHGISMITIISNYSGEYNV